MENNNLTVKGARRAEALALKSLALKSLVNKGARGAEALAVEPFFDGIRKDNARLIFGILLIIIIIDFGMEIIN